MSAKRLAAVALALALSIGIGDASAQVAWPRLPTSGFIAGRAATPADVQAGRAEFALAHGAVPASKPLPLLIPQYAYHRDGDKRVPVIVVQGEELGGRKFVGARMADGVGLVGYLGEFELLGREVPKTKARTP
ncbi:hypothetical protein RDV84_22445 [Lysobacter yananisis]|uniref:Alpha/beta hydrolase n=1 Tax=Lysobacter yananisis TaxID=1003114 RepID=A0ABY9P6L6_9GAMM|nr:hypothetical protein [Lysobacter yananisis]WMT02692.1 hypothetical protein RDV84_22445 [Lysobacter yananisis]